MIEAEALHSAAFTLDRMLAAASPAEIIAEAIHAVPPGRLAVVSSFGAESAVLLKYVADVDGSIPVLLLDTGWLFEETLAYRDTLVAKLGLTDVRTIGPSLSAVARSDPGRDLWFSEPDGCCALRKVAPLAEALRPFDAWVTGRKRYQGGERSRLAIVEADGRRLKFNPLAGVSQADVDAAFAANCLPAHPLVARGFASIGCMPCTSRTEPGEGARAGRWRGRGRTECGIHSVIKY